MEKFSRVDFLLNKDEYKEIEDYYKGYINSISIEKITIVSVGKEFFKFKLHLDSVDNGKDIRVFILEETPSAIGDAVSFITNTTNLIIGVNEITSVPYKGGVSGDSYHFFVNINKEYDKSLYPNKLDCYIDKLNILEWRGKYNSDLMYKEIAYQDFSTEFSIALASYCLFTNPKILLEDSKIFDLYDEKLSFNGFYIEDFVNTFVVNFEFSKSFEYLDTCKNKSEVLELILMYIANIKYGEPSYKSTIKEADIMAIGYRLYEKYLRK